MLEFFFNVGIKLLGHCAYSLKSSSIMETMDHPMKLIHPHMKEI
jgi:hypothetical protein